MTVSINGRYSHNFKSGVLVKETLNPANEAVNRGHYAATTLSAVDGDLAVGNIKKDTNIFGKVGTFESTLAEDVEGDSSNPGLTDYSSTYCRWIIGVPADGDTTLITKDLTYDANSLAFAVAHTACCSGNANQLKLQLYMGGVQMQESGFLSNTDSVNFVLRDFKALSGAQTCYLNVHCYGVGPRYFETFGRSTNSEAGVAIAVGSVKLV